MMPVWPYAPRSAHREIPKMLMPSEAPIHAQGRQAALLALISGYGDAFALKNYQVFASFMSGNTTQAGLTAGQANWIAAGHNLLPIPAFVIGIVVGTLISESRLRRPIRGLCGLTAAMLLLNVAVAQFYPNAGWSGIVVLSFAMGVLNTTITAVGGQPVSLGFVTGDLNNLGRHLVFAALRRPLSDSRASWDTRGRRAWTLGGVWGSFLLGAALCGAGMLVMNHWVLLPAAGVLCVLALFDRDIPQAAAA